MQKSRTKELAARPEEGMEHSKARTGLSKSSLKFKASKAASYIQSQLRSTSEAGTVETTSSSR